MLCRALFTIIAVSYLICVLILSGLQKDDLDVNMLSKLERHGLNIDDVNNENLREDCLSTKTTDVLINSGVPTSISSTTKMTLRKQLNRPQEQSNRTDKTELKAAIKYFMELQKLEFKSKTKNVEDVTPKSYALENYNIPQRSNLKYIYSDLIGYNPAKPKKDNLHQTTTDRSFQRFPQNVIKLWNTFSKHDDTSSVPTTTQTTTFNPIKVTIDQETDVIKKIIAEYISNNEKIQTTQLPVKKELDLAKLSDEFRKFLANKKINNENKPQKGVNIEEVNKNNPVTYFYSNKSIVGFHDNRKEPNKFLNVVPTLEDKNMITDIIKNKSDLPITDGMRLDEREDPISHKNIQMKEMLYTTEHAIVKGELEDYKLPKNDGIFNKINNLYTNIANNNNQNIKNEKSLPKGIIKEIAESVKAMVLNDLKKEISSIKTKSTSTTTEKSSTVTSKRDAGKGIQDTHMMEKFMELLQQFKSIEEKTIITGNSQMKVTEKKDIKHEFKGPVKVIYSSNKPTKGPYAVRSPLEQFAPIFVESNGRNYNDPPNMVNPIYQVSQINKYQVKAGLRLAPITIQTNSFEVPPLGIPIAKPIPVHQNIIVTTKSPHLRPRLDTHHTNYIHHIDRYNVGNDFRSRNDRQKPLIHPKSEFQSPARDDHYALNERDNLEVKKNYRSKFDDERDYRPHFTKSDYDRMKLRNQEIKRFHERLENTDESKNSDENCCKIRVASRQQLPLAYAKKRSGYDDVHFRNFLKTQQKVNDMLEKILAAKTKTDDPRSVETT